MNWLLRDFWNILETKSMKSQIFFYFFGGVVKIKSICINIVLDQHLIYYLTEAGLVERLSLAM